MNIDYFKLFVCIVNIYNISVVGCELNIFFVVVSVYINKLEEILGVWFIYRIICKVLLIDEGKVFLFYVEEVFISIEVV